MSKNKKTEKIEGFNPKVYRALSLIYIALTFLNVAMVIFFFSKTGFGLYHAEHSLACIAKIDNTLESVNTDILDIVVHDGDTKYITGLIEDISSKTKDIDKYRKEFKSIDLESIDPNVQSEFDVAIANVERYLRRVNLNAEDLQKGKLTIKGFSDETFFSEDKNLATSGINDLFIKQDAATYDFFSKVGKSFLIVIFFLLFTMGLALAAIQIIKKRDRERSIKLQESTAHTKAMREKAENIAYINIITGLKNRYALDEELQKRLAGSDFSIALYNFNNFNTLNENYGRQFADEFVANISAAMVEKFKDSAEFYSTSINEFCVIFNGDIPKHKIEDTAWQVVDTLSRTTHLHNTQVKMTVSACLYHYNAGDHKNANSLFMSLDKGINFAKQKSQFNNQSTLVPITK